MIRTYDSPYKYQPHMLRKKRGFIVYLSYSEALGGV